MASEEEVDRAAAVTARRLDVMLFLNELDEEYLNLKRLRNDAERIFRLWRIDLSRLVEQVKEEQR